MLGSTWFHCLGSNQYFAQKGGVTLANDFGISPRFASSLITAMLV